MKRHPHWLAMKVVCTEIPGCTAFRVIATVGTPSEISVKRRGLNLLYWLLTSCETLGWITNSNTDLSCCLDWRYCWGRTGTGWRLPLDIVQCLPQWNAVLTAVVAVCIKNQYTDCEKERNKRNKCLRRTFCQNPKGLLKYLQKANFGLRICPSWW